MKRFGTVLASVLLGSMIAGCDSGGIKEGSPPEPTTTGVTDNFRKTMEETGNKMMQKGQGKMLKKQMPKSVPEATKDDPDAPKKAP